MNTEIIARGQNAKFATETPEFKQFVEDVRKDLFNQFVRTNVGDVEKREQLHSVINGLELLLQKAAKYQSDADYEQNKEEAIPQA